MVRTSNQLSSFLTILFPSLASRSRTRNNIHCSFAWTIGNRTWDIQKFSESPRITGESKLSFSAVFFYSLIALWGKTHAPNTKSGVPVLVPI